MGVLCLTLEDFYTRRQAGFFMTEITPVHKMCRWLLIPVFQLAGFFDKSYWCVTLTGKGKKTC
ncbi:hypothetical protein ECSTECDG1313_1627 [Escherichia coli STEC_DG131-3]|nr:hypothetical protein [Escherichia coli]EGW95964.1 hypothetical protein ECSTECDG1313_1627 [Escherichia coli STEC_DG131-3]EIH25926.1 hypothetical protein EC12264_1122 [Escherichia coli 1.2264]EFI4361722.1 hypothetical protein [Escherichia coli]EFI9813058.1 hypothetical protein [Escherichia coli]